MSIATEKNMRRHSFAMVQWILLPFIISNLSSRADAQLSDMLRYTMPACAIACNADVLPRSTSCREDLEVFRDALDDRTLWSLRMLDSSGQPKSGFLFGNNHWLGSKNQCYETVNPEPYTLSPKVLRNNSLYRNSEEELAPYQLNYFAAYIVHNSTVQYHVEQSGDSLITLGLCLPASCNISDLSQILKRIFDDRILLVSHVNKMDLKLREMRNLTNNQQLSFPWRLIITLVIITTCVMVIIIATIYDIYVHQKNIQIMDLYNSQFVNEKSKTVDKSAFTSSTVDPPGTAIRILMCFSAYTNSKDIFVTSSGKDSIEALHGIRVLGMAWIILLHVLLFGAEFMDNKIWAYRIAESLPMQVFSNGTISVDTFFFMSGFLLAYTFFESAGKRSQDSEELPWRILFHRIIRRYIRLTAPYVITIGIADILFSWYGRTSQFYIHDRPHENCPAYWWRNVLYINNLFKRSEMCLFWSYYMSNDMQFFIIGSFLLFLSQRYHHTSIVLCAMLLAGSTITIGIMIHQFDYAPTLDEQVNTMDIFYDPPWMRIGPYLIGLAAAYLLIKVMRKQLNASKVTLGLLWIAGSACSVLTLFGLYERRLSIITTSIYMALHRTVWGIGLAWLVIACCTNHGGIINRILSLKIWQPMSKLSYCAYLLNPLVVAAVNLSSETSFHVDVIPYLCTFFGVITMSYMGSYVLAVTFEIPFALLANLYFEGKTKKAAKN